MSEHKKPKTLIRSSRSAPFIMPQPNGRPAQEMFGEIAAVYVETTEDVDNLIQLMASGRDYITTLEVEKDGSETGEKITAVIIRGVFPSKLSALTGGEKTLTNG